MSKNPASPPKLILRFLKWFCDPHMHRYLEGDLLELFEAEVSQKGSRRAKWGFFWEVLKLFRPGIIKSIYGQNKLNQLGMVRNYYKMAFRSIKKDRVHTFINVFGIAIGMAAVILILQYTSFEFSYDSFHKRKADIYRLDSFVSREGVEVARHPNSGYGYGPELMEKVPGIEAFLRIHALGGGAVVTSESESQSKRQFFEEEGKLYFVDQAFFQAFDFELLQGNESALLADLHNIVITEKIWMKYLPNVQEPIGKTLKIDGGRYPGTFRVSGILKNLPENSRFANIEFFLPMKGLLTAEQYEEDDGWGWSNFVTYVVKEPNADIRQIQFAAINIINDRREEESEFHSDLILSPFTDLHLRDQTRQEGITAKKLSFFLIIAFFIIVIAWLNYINLSTAQAMKRAKEVGVRKVIGAARPQLIAQFVLETLIINGVALLLAFGIAFGSLPLLESLTEKSFTLGEYIPVSSWLVFFGIFFLGTFLSGFYPALILSSFNPIVVIKGTSFLRNRKFGLRQVLVTFQLLIAICLITGTWSVYRQLHFMQNQDLGLEIDQVLNVRAPFVFENEETVVKKIDRFRDRLHSIAAVQEVSVSDALPGGEYNWGSRLTVEGSDEAAISIQMMMVDENFQNTYGMELLAGRFHDKALQSVPHQIVVNETTLEQFNLGSAEEAVGKRLKKGETFFPIIGVLKDFHWNSLRDKKIPTLLYYTNFGGNLSVKVSSKNLKETMARIGEHYEDIFPDNPFDYHFVDAYFNDQYKEDQQFGTIFNSFSIIAIVIACLGLFGLASFTLSLRIKEIGIRKILGAKVLSILTLIFKDYLLLIGLAAIFGIPVLYFLLENWLEDYAYSIEITPDLFLIPVIMLIAITFCTIGYQCIKAATRNPATSLRTE